MKIENKIYFAPGIEFKDVRWDDPYSLLDSFMNRVYAYYLHPARNMALWLEHEDQNQATLLGVAFSCGVLSCTTIDFLARVEYQIDASKKRFINWLENRIPGMAAINPDDIYQTIAERFYGEFRNGLVHEGRVKGAGQFSLDPDPFNPPNQVFAFVEHAMVVHPFNLLSAIETGLHQYYDELLIDGEKLSNFARYLHDDTFIDDIKNSTGA